MTRHTTWMDSRIAVAAIQQFEKSQLELVLGVKQLSDQTEKKVEKSFGSQAYNSLPYHRCKRSRCRKSDDRKYSIRSP